MTNFAKHAIGIAALLVAAIALWFWPSSAMTLDITVHDVYRVVHLNQVASCFLIAIAVVWFLIAAHRAIRQRSGKE